MKPAVSAIETMFRVRPGGLDSLSLRERAGVRVRCMECAFFVTLILSQRKRELWEKVLLHHTLNILRTTDQYQASLAKIFQSNPISTCSSKPSARRSYGF